MPGVNHHTAYVPQMKTIFKRFTNQKKVGDESVEGLTVTVGQDQRWLVQHTRQTPRKDGGV